MHSKDIQVLYEKHQLLTSKGKGIANALVGKTAMILFFVSDSVSRWNDSAKSRFSKTHASAMNTVIKAAQKYSVSLTIDTIAEEVTLPYACDNDLKSGDSDKWISAITDRFNKKYFRGYKYHFTEKLGYDQVAIAFVFNRDFRAYAGSDERLNAVCTTECSVLCCSSSERTILHELFHQFGAADLYYPDDVVKAVRKYNYLSLMGYGSGIHIDSLTAYLIGWSDEIDETTVALLEDTKHLRVKDIIIGRRNS